MKILYLGNNWVGWQVLRWLKQQEEDVVGLVLHPPERRKYGGELLETSGLEASRVFDGARIRHPDVLQEIRTLKADLAVSVLFGYVLKREFLTLFPKGCINLHPALLPYNRGMNPNVWSIVEGTPSGATLHFIDEGVDTGDVVAQREVPVEPIDTGASLYHKLEQACVALFADTWAQIRSGRASRIPQSAEAGSTHRARDISLIDEIDLKRTYQAGKLLDVLRARTFPPYPGAYFVHNGRKVYIDVELRYENPDEAQ